MDIIYNIKNKIFWRKIDSYFNLIWTKIYKVIRGRYLEKMIINDKGIVALLGLTYNCQCNCIHCGMSMYPKIKEKELKTSDWINVINDLSPEEVRSITFFGGESLLRTDLVELISFASSKGFKALTLDTNGYLLTLENVKLFKKAGLYNVEISIDDPNPENHDKSRGVNGLFAKLQNGIKHCLSENLVFGILTVATKKNVENGDLKKIISLAKNLGASYVRVLAPIPVGKLMKCNEVFTEKEKNKLKKIIDGRFSYLLFLNDYCAVRDSKALYVSPYGDVQPCPYMPISFGNIKKFPLKNITEKMLEWDRAISKMKGDACLLRNPLFRKRYIEQIGSKNFLPVPIEDYK